MTGLLDETPEAHGRLTLAVPLHIAGSFVALSIPGLFAGSAIGRRLTGQLLARVFAVAIMVVAVFVIARELLAT